MSVEEEMDFLWK